MNETLKFCCVCDRVIEDRETYHQSKTNRKSTIYFHTACFKKGYVKPSTGKSKGAWNETSEV